MSDRYKRYIVLAMDQEVCEAPDTGDDGAYDRGEGDTWSEAIQQLADKLQGKAKLDRARRRRTQQSTRRAIARAERNTHLKDEASGGCSCTTCATARDLVTERNTH